MPWIRKPDTLYAGIRAAADALWINGGGPDSAIYKTTDAGQLEKIDEGLPYEQAVRPGARA